MKNKDFEYTRLKIEDEVVGNTDTDKFIKDHINKGRKPSGEYIMNKEEKERLMNHLDLNTCKDPIPISGKALLRGFGPKGKEFIAKATNCTLRFEQPSEEQQKMIDESNKKMDELMAPINAAIAECASKLTDKLPFGVVRLEVDNKVIATIQLEHTHDDERK